MTDKEKLEKLKKLADAMYYAANYLTTDASRLHKAMEEYHQFIINEYHKKKPTIPDIVDEHFYEMLGEKPINNGLDLGCGVIWKDEEPVSDFTKALAECIHQAQCAVVDPMAHAEIWKKELLELAKGEMPVSEDLEEAAKRYAKEEYGRKNPATLHNRCLGCYAPIMYAFRNGAKWQKNHFWKSANGDDLPEYDREVIAILDYDFGHYKVVYAHRPNPNGWNGTNIDTEEKEHFEPVIYGKGGWNQPHVLYWLDAKLPYEENKIIK